MTEAANVLLSGALVAFPTETVYGLGACALDAAAVRKIFVAKGRPPGHPLIVHVNGQMDARELAANWPADAAALADAFWPGPLTLIVARGPNVPLEVTGGGDSVALRAPSHPVARALIAAAGPLAAPSANRYQTLSPTDAGHVVKSLGDAADLALVLDGGPASAGIESTVIDVRTGAPRLLRHGALGIAEVRRICPNVVDEAARVGDAAKDAVHVSPGQDAKHYAPRAELVVAATRGEAIAKALARATRGEIAGAIVRGDGAASDAAPVEAARVRTLPGDAIGYARELFATLHALDDEGCAVIVLEAVPAEDDAWRAVADRLKRAASR